MVKVLAQGAEAIITLVENLKDEEKNKVKNFLVINKKDNFQENRGGLPVKLENKGNNDQKILKESYILKDRVSKSYRLKELDEKIRKQRTQKEARILNKAKEIINVPNVLNAKSNGEVKDKFRIEMEFIEGDKLSEKLNSYKEEKQFEIMKELGKEVGKLHKKDIIHGDLTTSNVILEKNKEESTKNNPSHKLLNSKETPVDSSISEQSSPKSAAAQNKVFIIDFGLGFISKRIEDRAVDLHLIKQALEAKHFQNWEKLFENFLKGYQEYEKHKEVLEQLKKVEGRGRYRH